MGIWVSSQPVKVLPDGRRLLLYEEDDGRLALYAFPEGAEDGQATDSTGALSNRGIGVGGDGLLGWMFYGGVVCCWAPLIGGSPLAIPLGMLAGGAFYFRDRRERRVRREREGQR